MIARAFGAESQQLLCRITSSYSYDDLFSIIPDVNPIIPSKNNVSKPLGCLV